MLYYLAETFINLAMLHVWDVENDSFVCKVLIWWLSIIIISDALDLIRGSMYQLVLIANYNIHVVCVRNWLVFIRIIEVIYFNYAVNINGWLIMLYCTFQAMTFLSSIIRQVFNRSWDQNGFNWPIVNFLYK